MKHLLLAATLFAGPALAQDGPMAGVYGNTIVATAPDKTVTKTYIDPDGTYRSVVNGAESKGTWAVKKGLLCYTATTPAPAPPLCTVGANKKVGSKWSIVAADDTSTKVVVVAGR